MTAMVCGYPRALTTGLRRAKGGLATLATIALLVGCSPTTPSPLPSASDPINSPSPSTPLESPAPSSSSAAIEAPPARWSDCGNGAQCAEVRVPSDYAATSTGYLDISILKLTAPDRSQRIGSLIINPGGPGASGVDFVRQAAASGLFSPALLKRFDIVGFDPRGVNSSTAIRCIDNLDLREKDDPTPDDAAGITALANAAKSYATECGRRNDQTLPYMSTDAVARDLDLIREAVGDTKLTYLGFSYGTLIGSLYADLFPDHVRAMVLDGAIDPALDLEQVRFGQAKGFERDLTDFLDDCAAKATCTFHENGDPAGAFDALMASIDARPLPANLAKSTREIGPAIAWYSVLGALYAKASWPTLAASLELAKRGDGSLMLLIADPYRGRKPNGSYSNQVDAYTANTCLDFPAPTDVSTYTSWAKAFKDAAPHFAKLMAYNDLPCAFWPVPAERTPKKVTAAGAPPIVVVGSTRDPATPYAWAVSLSKEPQSGVLVTRQGDGHTAYGVSSCIRKAVDPYLLDLTVPKDGLTCSK
jgi:pimeloyl-ACP methyl ester carboxylesterase